MSRPAFPDNPHAGDGLDASRLEIRGNLEHAYDDIFTPRALAAMRVLASYDRDRKTVMDGRIERRARRARDGVRIGFLDPDSVIPRTGLTVRQARQGMFAGSEIPPDLQRQWIQGTGPATKPNAPVEKGLRNIAYALLS